MGAVATADRSRRGRRPFDGGARPIFGIRGRKSIGYDRARTCFHVVNGAGFVGHRGLRLSRVEVSF